MNRLERLHALSETIRRASPTPVSASRLAERFEVSVRTIERDLAALRSAGVPLYAEAGRRGGQVRLDGPGQSVMSLSASEVSSLLIALAAAGPGMPFADAGETAANRLLESLGPRTRHSVDELSGNDSGPRAAPAVPSCSAHSGGGRSSTGGGEHRLHPTGAQHDHPQRGPRWVSPGR